MDSVADVCVRNNPDIRQDGQEHGESPNSIELLRRMCALLREAMPGDSGGKS